MLDHPPDNYSKFFVSLTETFGRCFLFAAEGRKAFAWRHADRIAKGVNVIIRGKSWEHLVKGRDEANQTYFLISHSFFFLQDMGHPDHGNVTPETDVFKYV